MGQAHMVDFFGVVPARRTETLEKEEEDELRKLGLLGRRKRYRGQRAEGFNEDMINAIFKVYSRIIIIYSGMRNCTRLSIHELRFSCGNIVAL